jgi:molybdopterin converting factor small subunit
LRVKVSLSGIPILSEVVGSRRIDLDFVGNTVGDVIRAFINRYGYKVRKILLDENGKIDPSIQISINNEIFIPHENYNIIVNEGDEVSFFMLVSGG